MRKQKFESVEDAYRELAPELANYAKRHLVEQDKYLDAVHDAFVKLLEYQRKHPEKAGVSPRISYSMLYREVMRACRRINKRDRPASLDDRKVFAYYEARVGRACGGGRRVGPHSGRRDGE